MFTINLGPFSGKNAPEIHYHPSIADRILEGTAALCLLSGIGIVCWNYFHTDLLSDYGVYGIFISIVVFALLFGGAYAPVRCINFPVTHWKTIMLSNNIYWSLNSYVSSISF